MYFSPLTEARSLTLITLTSPKNQVAHIAMNYERSDGHEQKRLLEVQDFLNLEFEKNADFQNITNLVSELCEKPIALITILDHDTNWIKVATGVDQKMAPRQTSFCQYCIQQQELLIVPDTTEDVRFKDNPIVTDAPGIRFYAGAPLTLNNGYTVGSLCVFDVKPNNLSESQKKILTLLSRQVALLMEFQLSEVKLKNYITEIEAKNTSLRSIAQLQSHDIRQPLTTIMGLVYLAKDGLVVPDNEWLHDIDTVCSILDSRIRSIINETMGVIDIKLLRFNKMVEEIEDYAILLLDKDGTIENWNRGAEILKGYKADEIIGKNFAVFYNEMQRNANRPKRLLEEAAKNGTARDEGLRVRKNGSTFLARVVITAIHDEKGQVVGFTKVTRDRSR